MPRAALAALRQLTGLVPEPYLVTDTAWTSLANAYAEAVEKSAASRPAAKFVKTNSLSDAVARIASAATTARQARVTEAQWDPYTWVRVQGSGGLVQDVLLAKLGKPEQMEEPCRAVSTSH